MSQIKPRHIKYETTVAVEVTGNELINKANGDLFSITPDLCKQVARDKIANNVGTYELNHKVKKESQSVITDDGKDTTITDKK